MDDRKIVKRGLWGAALFGLISTVIWVAFVFFGLPGFLSSPFFGILIPLGFFIFGRRHEFTTRIIVSYCALAVAFILISIYSGWLLNSYAEFLMYNGYSSDGVNIFEVMANLRFAISGNVLWCLLEIGKGLGGTTVFLIISTLFLKRRTK